MFGFFSKKSVSAVPISQSIYKTNEKLVNTKKKKRKRVKPCSVQFEEVLVKKRREKVTT